MLTTPACLRAQDGGIVLAGVPHKCNAEASSPVASFAGLRIAETKNTPGQTMNQGAGVTEEWTRHETRNFFELLLFIPLIHRPTASTQGCTREARGSAPIYAHSYTNASELAFSPGVPNGTSSSDASRITQPSGSPFRQVSTKPSLNTKGSSLQAVCGSVCSQYSCQDTPSIGVSQHVASSDSGGCAALRWWGAVYRWVSEWVCGMDVGVGVGGGAGGGRRLRLCVGALTYASGRPRRSCTVCRGWGRCSWP